MNRSILNLLILAIFVLAGFAVYSNSFQNGYHYDDVHHIVGNQYLTSIRNIPLFFTDSRTFSSLPEARNHYRPLLLTSYALNYHFSKLRPAGYHIVNLSFHIGSAFLIFLIVQAMVGSHPHPIPPPLRGREKGRGSSGFFAALAAGLIFLTTPFNSEVVNYISARSSVMCTFFYLLAFYCWVKYREVGGMRYEVAEQVAGGKKEGVPSPATRYPLPATYYIASLLAFLLAMLTKEIAITLPVMIFVYDVCFGHPRPIPPPLRGREKGRGKIMRSCSSYLPFILVAGIAGFVLRKIVCGNILSVNLSAPRGGGVQFFTELRLILKYIYMTVIPIRLSVDHPVEVSSSLWEPKVLVSLMILILICYTLFFLRRSKDPVYRSISFLGIWFLITLSPTVVIPLNAMFQENRGYLSAIGIVGIAGILLDQGICSLRFSEKARTYLSYGLLFAFVGVYGGLTWNRNKVWKDDVTLWKDVERKYTLSRGAQLELGRIHMAQDPEQGEKELKEVLRKDPGDISAMNNLGNLYVKKGRYDLAGELYLKAIEINPNDYKPHFNLAKVYKERGDKEGAVREYREVLKLAPDNVVAAEFLAELYAEMGKKEMIEGAFQSASQEDPRNPAFHRGLGITYARQQKWDMAAEAYKKVLEITPDDVLTRIDLGDSYIRLGKLALAEQELHRALGLEPSNGMANQGLGLIYQKQGRYDLALKHYEKAIEGRKASPKVLNNMGAIDLATGKTGKAIEAFKEVLRIDPSYHIARINLGRAYEAQSRIEEARKEYRKVLEAGDREKIPAEVYQEAKRRLEGLGNNNR